MIQMQKVKLTRSILLKINFDITLMTISAQILFSKKIRLHQLTGSDNF